MGLVKITRPKNARYGTERTRTSGTRFIETNLATSAPSCYTSTVRTACRCSSVDRSEEHTSELQSHLNLVCRLLLEKKKVHEHCSPSGSELSMLAVRPPA